MKTEKENTYNNEKEKYISCKKSCKINFRRYMPDGWNKLYEITDVDEKDITTLGYSKIITFYLPMLKDIDYEKDKNNLTNLERGLLLFMETDPDKLREIAKGNEVLEEFAEDIIKTSDSLVEQGVEIHDEDPHKDLSVIVNDIDFL